MKLRYMGWIETADLIIKGIGGASNTKTVTCDFARLNRSRSKSFTPSRMLGMMSIRI